MAKHFYRIVNEYGYIGTTETYANAIKIITDPQFRDLYGTKLIVQAMTKSQMDKWYKKFIQDTEESEG